MVHCKLSVIPVWDIVCAFTSIAKARSFSPSKPLVILLVLRKKKPLNHWVIFMMSKCLRDIEQEV